MQSWIARHNIEDFEKILAGTTDPARRELIEMLLKDERRKYREAMTGREPEL